MENSETEKYKKVLKESLCEIEKKYIEQFTIIPKKFKYNERVFAYELYHQIRCKSKELQNITISGEAVKSKFQFQQLGKNRTPDMLLHNFGTNDNNEVVIEIKTNHNAQSVRDGLVKDFQLLDVFTDNSTGRINYKLGLIILLHSDFKTILGNDGKLFRTVKNIMKSNTRIEVWNIPEPTFTNDDKLKEESIKIYSNKDLKQMVNE